MANVIFDRSAKLRAGLYIVATPIGNLADLSDRAKSVLSAVDIIACEDTRVSGKLLMAYGIKATTIAYHEHNGEKQRPRILRAIEEGKAVALISDAGTPMISDPGYKLADDVRAAGLPMTAIPGACAVINALTLAGLPTDQFTFVGFPPSKSGARRHFFEDMLHQKGTLVFYEAARRLPESIKDLADFADDRQIATCREMTKKFEQVLRGTARELLTHYENSDTPKGEAVVVVGPDHKNKHLKTDGLDVDKALKLALGHMKVKDAAAFVAELSGLPRKELYSRALEFKDK